MISSQQEYQSRRFIMNLLLFLSGKNIYHNLSQVSQVLQQTIGGGVEENAKTDDATVRSTHLTTLEWEVLGSERASECTRALPT